MYHYLDYKEANEMLRRAGFTHAQIDRLTRYRRRFLVGEMDQIPVDQRHLEFIRWLFQRGKLSDYVA
ncbi:hypothetical protein [Tengunoibacter tsumagoiensis]|uniref:Uncharacterized protein n=1 Tax=Tengunoibacter tsumagoiensis TaxID=2014871 RepID=A0A402A3E5_9CHLR|nr:hypothetical protein [Tengunoibacter tsumagoiensis]GCE13664.1 hypothetical protein KTT_35230 [Tengunoibacter tsumagoiensis]